MKKLFMTSLLFIIAISYFTYAQDVIFLHHSTGSAVYEHGDVPEYIETYNTDNGTNYSITERSYPNDPYPWNNYPYDYWHLWVDGNCNSAESGIECLSTLTEDYDVIIWKHCYPGAGIAAANGTIDITSSTKTIANYKLQYYALKTKMAEFPNTKFIVWTLAPLHRLATDSASAARAREFVEWVNNDWLINNPGNIYIFDFFGLAAELEEDPANGETNCLKYDYEKVHVTSDSHPNLAANQAIGPEFAQRIIDVIEDNTTVTLTPPILTAPEDLAVDVAVHPLCNWDAVTNATSYQIQISKVVTFETVEVYEEIIAPTTQHTVADKLDEGEFFYWRVRAKADAVTGTWSEVRSFTTEVLLHPPVLVSPLMEAERVLLRPTFSWESVELANSYYIEISAKQDYSTTAISQSISKPDTTYKMSYKLLQNTKYYWRMRSINTEETSEWSPSSWFYTKTTPEPPVLILPAHKSKDIILTPTFSWNVTSHAVTYILQVAKDVSFEDDVIVVREDIDHPTAEYTITTKLDAETDYYWRISVYDGEEHSDWSISRKFTTKSVITAPVILEPADLATGVLLQPTFDWVGSSIATSYTIEVCLEEIFFENQLITENIDAGKWSSYIPDITFEENTKYYWRMNATDGTDYSDWSPVRSFTTKTLPSAPVLSAPEDLETNVILKPKLRWVSDPVADTYLLEVSSDIDFHNLIIEEEVDAAHSIFTSTVDLSENSDFYWHVRVFDGEDYSDWSITYLFTTKTLPTAPILTYPKKYATDLPLKLQLDWDDVSGATKYGVNVSKTDDFAKLDFAAESPVSYINIYSGLELNTQYFWKIQASDGVDWSEWSQVFNFTTEEFDAVYDDKNSNMKILPNPASNNAVLFVDMESNSDIEIEIYNINGIMVDKLYKGPNIESFAISLQNLSTGIYNVVVRNAKDVKSTKLIVVK